MRSIITFVLFLCSAICFAQSETAIKWKLEVSPNRQFLQYTDGTPFFWMGNTAWLLPSALNREEADEFLSSRMANELSLLFLQHINCQ